MSTPIPRETLTILVPAYNEAATIVTALERLWAVDLPVVLEIIVIDDASSDGTGRLVSEVMDRSPVPLTLLTHERNRGKTAALRTGLQSATGSFTMIYDADLEYDPVDIPALLAPVLDGRADAVYGSRFLSPERRVLFFWHALGNRLVTALANMFANLNLTDMETCFKLVRTDVLRSMRIRSERFGFEPEVTVKMGRMGLRVYEIPIRYSGRSYEEGKKIGFLDAIRAVGTIIRAGVFESPVASQQERTRYALGHLGTYYKEILRHAGGALGDSVLEFAPGAGEVSMHLMQKSHTYLTDPDEQTLSRLTTRFSHRPNVETGLWPFDIERVEELKQFDTVVCLHGAGDPGSAPDTIKALSAFLKPDGRMILLLPALPSLHGAIDRGIGMPDRFSRKEARNLVESAGLTLETIRPVNAVGAIGWWLASKLMRSGYIRPLHVRVFRLLMPLFKLERWIRPPFGLSYLIVASSEQ
jgi:SAM-dependent methyltransferase